MTPPDNFIAIDPGLAATGGSGWAFFLHGRLSTCGVIRNPKGTTVFERIRFQRAYAEQNLGGARVCEFMTKRYGPAAAKMDVQDLIDLNALAGALGTYFVTPGDWKGGVPREVEQSRSWLALDEAERAVITEAFKGVPKSTHKEILSAAGIGLSVAGRCHRKCGWPG